MGVWEAQLIYGRYKSTVYRGNCTILGENYRHLLSSLSFQSSVELGRTGEVISVVK